MKRFETAGEISPARTGGDRRSDRIEAHRDYPAGSHSPRPDMTLLEIPGAFVRQLRRTTLHPCCGAFSIAATSHLKKSPRMPEQQRADVLKQRRDWFARQLEFDPSRLVFIDETGASTNLSRKSGRCRRGRRLRAAVRHGHTGEPLVAGLRLRGLVAQKAFDRPINAASFEDWIEQCLVPTLSQGDVVVMDNLSTGPRVEQLIKSRRRRVEISAPLQPGYEPHRKGLFQAESLPAQNRQA